MNIGQSFNERQGRFAALDDVIGKLNKLDAPDEAIAKAQKRTVEGS